MLELNYRLRPDFFVRELCCKCGCGYGRELEHYEDALLDLIQAMRDEIGLPLAVMSGLRCEAHNEAEGGVELSAHTRALAVDFAAGGTFARRRLVDAAVHHDASGIGVARGFIHVDADRTGLLPRPGIWSY